MFKCLNKFYGKILKILKYFKYNKMICENQNDSNNINDITNSQIIF